MSLANYMVDLSPINNGRNFYINWFFPPDFLFHQPLAASKKPQYFPGPVEEPSQGSSWWKFRTKTTVVFRYVC